MFPLNWNIPFIRKNGSRTTLGAITGDIVGIEEDVAGLAEKTDSLLDNMVDNGVVNSLPYPYNNTTKTTADITYTDNGDGTIYADGTSSALATFALATGLHITKATKITGCPSGGADGKYAIEVYNSTKSTRIGYETGNGFVIPAQDAADNIAIYIQIWTGQTVSNIVFMPMFSDPSLNLSYADYLPYAKTNKELTDDVNHNLQSTTALLVVNDTKVFNIDTTKTLFGFTFSRYGCSMSWVGPINRLSSYNDPANAQIVIGSNTSLVEQSVFFSAVYDSTAKTITLKILQLSSHFASGVQADFWQI